MMIVGLTGGIGSGKSSVLQLFMNRDIPVYVADIEAKKLMQTDSDIKAGVIANFGEKAYDGQKLNTVYIAKQVFGNEKKLQALNALIHPAVHRHFLQYAASQTAPYLIYESAILFETGSYTLCDYVICVTAPIDVRIMRIMQRDKLSEEDVKKRMQHQWEENLKKEKSNFVIQNVDWENTQKTVDALHKKLLKIHNSKRK